MIAFSCAHCGKKFEAKPEYAGRSARCPSCKERVVVPHEGSAATVSPSRIEGALSSLARAGVAAEVSLAWHEPTDQDEAARPVAEVLAGRHAEGQRYLLEGEIARGGMGAVVRAVDCDIRREVAIKYMLDQSNPRKKTRFVEEAQITGQLEHPNIVPIHELGVDAKGRLFFSMKMVRGRSLQKVLYDLHYSPRTAEKEYSLGRMLNIFVNVCHGLAYAHSRGVVHRDLKPANIMIGDFGEVYVMDWGLAKVVARDELSERSTAIISATPAFDGIDEESSGTSSATVQTDRANDEQLTRDGTVLGTALYMPPEQASGNNSAVDRYSDIYSLGAILYEILSLEPPVDRTGGVRAILRRVAEGEIIPPEQRVPERARNIPPELSAVAMKALAREKKDRYPTVEALRRDIELYLEGRSVSAREDTRLELLRKFVKRNKGLCAGIAAAFLVLMGSLFFIGLAWLHAVEARRTAEANYAAYQREQQEKQARTAKAVPALVEAARLAAQNHALDDALMQLDLAHNYDPDYAPADLVRGQILIGKLDFAAASESLRRYTQKRSNDADTRELLRLCQQARPDDGATLLAITDVLVRQKALGAANSLMAVVGKLGQKREQLLPLLRKRIEASWPGLGDRLKVASDGGLQLDLANCGQVGDLTPLKGMPLTWLSLRGCGEVRDLSPLKGMPLTYFNLYNCAQVRDLSPLKGMPLITLDLTSCKQVQDLSPLTGMPLAWLSLWGCGQVSSLSPLKSLPLTTLDLSSCAQVQDLSPLKEMRLTTLTLTMCPVADLSPLKGMALTTLTLNMCPVVDLSPLKGMPLTVLNLNGCAQVRDLSPLSGMPLKLLILWSCDLVRDLSALKDLPLNTLWLPPQVDRGMNVLRQINTLKKLKYMAVERTVEEFWKKYDAGEFKQLKP
jgi:serine/threonine protein kinase/DNA-directed RNA polymerase subunit RPC12/RpoP